MQIGASTLHYPLALTDKQATAAQTASEQQQNSPPPKQPFEPAPPLRPTLEDKIEMTAALMALRGIR